MTELTIDFNEAYNTGINAGAGQIPPWAIGINGRIYLIDMAKNYVGEGRYKREGIDVLQQRNTTNQRDTLLLPQDVWRSQQESWHQGAGQRNLDREDALPYRFYRSYGIDPWTRYEFSLLNATTKILNLTTTKATFLQPHNGYLVSCTGTTLTWIAANLTTTNLTVGTTDIISVAYDGDAILTLHSDGKVFRSTNTTTTAQLGATTYTGATFIAYVKDYLIVGMANVLKNITGGGAGTAVYTSPITGFTWKGATEGNSSIYLIGGSGDKHVVHRLGIKQDGTGITPAVVAASLPDGEIGYSIGSYLGYIFIGTDKGVRMATADSGGDLSLGALIPTLKPVLNFEGQDRFVWVTASDVDPVQTAGTPDATFPTGKVCGLYRLDLSTFTVSNSTPAYATDIVASDQSDKTVQSVVTWNNKRVFSVNNGGVYLEDTVKMPAGWIEQGRISYSVEDPKTGLYAQTKFEPLHGRVSVELSYDDAAPIRILSWGIEDSIRSGNINLDGAQFSRVDSRIILTRDSVTTTRGPVFTRFELRSRAVKGASSRWTIPIINHEVIDINGIPENRDVLAEFDRLMALVESGRMFAFQEWGRSYSVVAKDFAWNPQKLTSAGDGWQGVFTLIVEEVR